MLADGYLSQFLLSMYNVTDHTNHTCRMEPIQVFDVHGVLQQLPPGLAPHEQAEKLLVFFSEEYQ